jgi:hypothetical protein
VDYTAEVQCDANDEVTNIIFRHALVGTVPQAAVDALFAINSLQAIDLSENDLNGTLPQLSSPQPRAGLTQLQLGE